MSETNSDLTNNFKAGCSVMIVAISALVIAGVHFYYNYTSYGFIMPGHSAFFWGCMLVAAALFGVIWYIGQREDKIKEKMESDAKKEDVEEKVKDKLKDF